MNKDEAIKEAVKTHLEEIKSLAVDLGVYSEKDIDNVPLDDLIKFGLSYQIIWLDKMLKDGTDIKKNTTSNLRLYNEMCKNVIGIKQTIKDDKKIQISDPLEQLRKSLKIQEIK